ncbi:MAG TPA: hypothetical protein VFV00_17715 [Acidimicrobiales bacterium]|nr:hypothetical protein [Acidimicrobiales bacterium]
MGRRGTRRLVAVLGAGLLLTIGLQACSSDDNKPVSLTVNASEPSADQFKLDLPASMDGGVVKIDFKNTGKQAHELQLVHVKDGTTPDQFTKDVLEAQDAPIPDYLLGAGGVGAIGPGQSATTTQKLEPGSYIYFCSLGDGDAVHYKHGMLGSLKVDGDKGKGDLPKADASVKAREYGFDLSGLKAGSNTVSFENTGKEFHHAVIAPLAPGTTFDQAKAAMSAPPDQQTGPPPIEFDKAASLSVLTPGGNLVQTNVSLSKGTYVVLCFLTDKTGGPPHFTKGMFQELDIS